MLIHRAVCRFKASAYRELAERTERHQKLQGLVAEMARQKELMVSFVTAFLAVLIASASRTA